MTSNLFSFDRAEEECPRVPDSPLRSIDCSYSDLKFTLFGTDLQKIPCFKKDIYLPLRHWGTLNSHQGASPLVRLVGGL
ncbi:hypothetical protein TNCV_1305271 [Trichonephila clavipes]|nr:hypothetical protein TNCV_1305271 [Trichonephila clavipes]